MTTDNKKPKNPFAFPCVDVTIIQEGMTLRDYFANSAMQGMIANTEIRRPDSQEIEFEAFAKRAYRYADAMLKQREL